MQVVDCGGGLGIPYRNQPGPGPEALAGAIKAAFHNLDVRVALEPGRWLVGPAGVLLASVILQKQSPGNRFVVLDAAMNDLVRPAMYDAWHGIVPVSAAAAVAPVSPCDIVGPVCETGDTFARDRLLPSLSPGRGCRDPRRGCLWCGHEFPLQRPPASGRGAGRRRRLDRHPPPPDARSALG